MSESSPWWWAPLSPLAIPILLAALAGWIVIRRWNHATASKPDRARRGLFVSLATLTGWYAPFLWTIPVLDAIEPLSRPRGSLRVYFVVHVLTLLGIPIFIAVGIAATIFWIGMSSRGDPRQGIALGTIVAWGLLGVAAAMTPIQYWVPME